MAKCQMGSQVFLKLNFKAITRGMSALLVKIFQLVTAKKVKSIKKAVCKIQLDKNWPEFRIGWLNHFL